MDCPNGCGRAVNSGHLMCVVCWRRVPPDLQRDVYRTWRRYCSNPSDENYATYAATREAALAAIGSTS